MVTHQFSEEHTQQWFDACVECVLNPDGPLDKQPLVDVVDYLVNLVPELCSRVRQDRRHVCYPVVCELPGGMRISERSLWSLVFDNLDDAGSWVTRYIEALCDELPYQSGLDDHMYPTEPYYCAGARALYGYFDYLEDIADLRNPDNIPVFNAFRRWLHCLDMDHEVYEDDYILLVLNHGLRGLEPREMFLDLLHFRLGYGQFGLGSRGYNHITSIVHIGDFKPLIDFHIDTGFESGQYVEGWDFDEYRILIAAIYGSAREPADEVLSYVESRTGRAVPDAESYRLRKIETLAADRDLFLKDYRGNGRRLMNTGFHSFNSETRIWEKNSP